MLFTLSRKCSHHLLVLSEKTIDFTTGGSGSSNSGSSGSSSGGSSSGGDGSGDDGSSGDSSSDSSSSSGDSGSGSSGSGSGSGSNTAHESDISTPSELEYSLTHLKSKHQMIREEEKKRVM